MPKARTARVPGTGQRETGPRNGAPFEVLPAMERSRLGAEPRALEGIDGAVGLHVLEHRVDSGGEAGVVLGDDDAVLLARGISMATARSV